MTITIQELDHKIDNLQEQIDMMQRGDMAFRGYVHRQFETIFETMTTKEDLRQMESRLRFDLATKDDLAALTLLVKKIADKVGVSP